MVILLRRNFFFFPPHTVLLRKRCNNVLGFMRLFTSEVSLFTLNAAISVDSREDTVALRYRQIYYYYYFYYMPTIKFGVYCAKCPVKI